MRSSGILPAMVGATRMLRDRRRDVVQARQRRAAITPSEPARRAAADLRRSGYLVVSGYYSAERCAALRGEIDRIMAEQPDVVQRDKVDADHRVFGAEHASTAIAAFHDDDFLHGAGEAYGGRALVNHTTLAARLRARPGNLGSGQGWHRDAFHFQYKAMIYLTDVGPENGPFQFLADSHRPLTIFADMLRGRLDAPPLTRLSEAQIARLLGRDQARLTTFSAAAGTLILFDSSAIHRGSPIGQGVRYALTNYYYEPHQLVDAMKEKFFPLARARARSSPVT